MPDYKAHLDQAADRVKNPQPPSSDQPEAPSSFMEKIEQVSRNIPVIGTMLGSSGETEKNSNQAQQATAPAPSGPPDRPAHDTQIEEFLKDQHHSRKVVGDDQGPVGTA